MEWFCRFRWGKLIRRKFLGHIFSGNLRNFCGIYNGELMFIRCGSRQRKKRLACVCVRLNDMRLWNNIKINSWRPYAMALLVAYRFIHISQLHKTFRSLYALWMFLMFIAIACEKLVKIFLGRMFNMMLGFNSFSFSFYFFILIFFLSHCLAPSRLPFGLTLHTLQSSFTFKKRKKKKMITNFIWHILVPFLALFFSLTLYLCILISFPLFLWQRYEFTEL